ncbi:class 1 fructose-bisphosphatase [Winogradskyella sp.]|uniref:class 1 fructose-bisphosphatase n=1 Tax=Winogradskyella sp. TaxID=1883156 RepID=UPI0035113CFC
MKTLGEFIIENQNQFEYSTGELSKLLNAIRLAAKSVNHEVNKAGLVDILGVTNKTNSSNEIQQKLDVFANEAFKNALINRNIICGFASEEEDSFIRVLDQNNKATNNYVVLVDPLDGSSNIDTNVSVGTIFSIYKRVTEKGTTVSEIDFLQKGGNQIAAGYILYGTSTMLVYTTGYGVNGFTLNPALGTFYLSHPNMKFPEKGHIYSINEGNYNHFPIGVKKFIKYCQEDKDQRPYSSRYIGSLVSDFHRNLIKGGVYLYPSTLKHPNGKLRLLYECNPIAFLSEQAGGTASNGTQRILDIEPKSLHQCEPFYCGTNEMVENIYDFLNE